MKLIICSEIIYSAITNSNTIDFELVDKGIKGKLGLGWSVTSLMQWLTGKSAWKEFELLPENFNANGLTKEKVKLIIALANDFCANINPETIISNGFKVKNFLDSQELTLNEKVELLDNKKLH